MSTSTATPSATISRTKAKSLLTDIRRVSSRAANLIDTAASNPGWAEQQQAPIDRALVEALDAIEQSAAALRKGLGLR